MGDELLEEDVLALGVILEDLVPAVASCQKPLCDVEDRGSGPGPVRPMAHQEGLQHVEDGLEAVLLGHLLLGPHGLNLEARTLMRGWRGTEQSARDLNIDFESIKYASLISYQASTATDKLFLVKVSGCGRELFQFNKSIFCIEYRCINYELFHNTDLIPAE